MRNLSSRMILTMWLYLCCVASLALEQNTIENTLAQAKASGKKANHLIDESSPYLLQHAYNPVNWFAWGNEAFEKARRENKPIFLSIGYSTCHWCHVMAHESFENEIIAGILNQYFVAIKVDREERPDIDNVYMAATQLINGQGGWPMTVFLNHRLEPFHAATYLPPETQGNYRGLKALLLEIHRLWTEQRTRVDDVAGQVAERMRADASETTTAETLHHDVHSLAIERIAADFDAIDGGFGGVPKFPRPGIYLYLLALAQQGGEYADRAKAMMRTTLDHMMQGGIYDQLGGGFHRYSVDAQWQVPHFEKMLYSQALSVMAYTRMYSLDAKTQYQQVVVETLEFVLREMTSPGGGFYCALDADSERAEAPGEHAEGAYYLWDASELEHLLGKQVYTSFADYYSVLAQGNIASDPQSEFGRRNILHINTESETKSLDRVLQQARKKLLTIREQRPRPHLDDKILTAWNGMMISAFIEAYSVFKQERWLTAAQEALGYLQKNLIDAKTGQLLRRARGDHAGIIAGLDDYAWTIYAMLDMYEVTHDKSWLAQAQKLQQVQDSHLFDTSDGAYFDSDDTDQALLFRSKQSYDNALPSANAVSILNLSRLAAMGGDNKYRDRADKLLAAFASAINQDPSTTSMMLMAESVRNQAGTAPR